MHFGDKTGNMPVKLAITIIQRFYKKITITINFSVKSIFTVAYVIKFYGHIKMFQTKYKPSHLVPQKWEKHGLDILKPH